MRISFSDLPPNLREQVLAKVAIEEARRQRNTSKYHAKKVQGCLADGTPHTFDSVKEWNRYQLLACRQSAGEISDLRIQVNYPLIPNQKLTTGKTMRGVIYVADFVYTEDGKTVVEDVKGYRDGGAYRVFVIKKKLMKFIHNIEVAEV